MKPEAFVQRDITGAAVQLGFRVFSLDQGYRPAACTGCGRSLGSGAGGTRQTLGISDLYMIHVPKRMAVWVEVKAGRNRPTNHQEAFLLAARRASLDAFPAWCVTDFLWGLRAAGFEGLEPPAWQETSKHGRRWITALYPHIEYPWDQTEDMP